MTRDLCSLTDADLLAALAGLTRQAQESTADLLAHLIEVDRRRLHLREGCASLFTYAVERLHFSEDEAAKRIHAARTARDYPVILDLVAAGVLHLTAVNLLAPHLTRDNHADLLAAARHLSKRQIEELIAWRFPKPDVPTRLARLPEPRPPAQVAAPLVSPSLVPPAAAVPLVSPSLVPPAVAAPLVSPSLVPPAAAVPAVAPPTLASSAVAPSAPVVAPRATLAPLAPERYRLQVTLSGAAHAHLRRAQALTRHQNPAGDLSLLLEQALAAYCDTLETRRLGRRARREPGAPSASQQSVRAPTQVARPDSPPVTSAPVADAPAAAQVTPPDSPPVTSAPVADASTAAQVTPRDAPLVTSAPIADVPTAAQLTPRPSEPPHAEAPPAQVAPEQPPAPASPRASARDEHAPEHTSRTRASPRRRSRYIPLAVRRAVAERDGMRCTYASADGHRCTETALLELHHLTPFARGGESTLEGLTLRCRAHNAHQAALDFGVDHVRRRIAEKGTARSRGR